MPVRTWLDALERFVWFALAAAIGGAWAFYETLTGRDIPGHAHPILGALVAAALTFGGLDLRRLARARRYLDGSADIAPAIRESIAARIAQLESEEPEVLHAIQQAAKRPRKKGGA